jgi:hypothetical protein
MFSHFKVGDILLDKIVPSSRVLVVKKHKDALECLFLDGYMKDKTVLIRNTFTYKKVGSSKEVKL